MLTLRLEVRQPEEADRARFLELFCDDGFMVFSSGVHSVESASARFDEMLERSVEFPFAKQPVVERSTGVIVGYSGVDWCELEGERRLEFGYRMWRGRSPERAGCAGYSVTRRCCRHCRWTSRR